ncbi:GreA/GreB family elongation factor [Fulvivirga lutea]|nr:GreA/GreB family elongation factor [Fulvivirga lutea]
MAKALLDKKVGDQAIVKTPQLNLCGRLGGLSMGSSHTTAGGCAY